MKGNYILNQSNAYIKVLCILIIFTLILVYQSYIRKEYIHEINY